ARTVPSGENARDRIAVRATRNEFWTWPSSPLWNKTSVPRDVARRAPPGTHARATSSSPARVRTEVSGADRTARNRPLSASQSVTVPSPLAAARVEPSGAQARGRIGVEPDRQAKEDPDAGSASGAREPRSQTMNTTSTPASGASSRSDLKPIRVIA